MHCTQNLKKKNGKKTKKMCKIIKLNEHTAVKATASEATLMEIFIYRFL